MKVLIDTDVLLDFLQNKKESVEPAFKIFTLADTKKLEVYISNDTFLMVQFMIRKLKGQDVLADFITNKIFDLMHLAILDAQTYDIVEELYFEDFADGVKVSQSIQTGAKYFITNDTKKYKTDKIQVISPEEFIQNI